MTVIHSTSTGQGLDHLELSFDQPLPRALVHKSGVGEVFVTDSQRLAPDLVAVAGQLPWSHAFYSDAGSSRSGIDLMAILELGRQSVYVVGNRHLGIPLHAKYVIRHMRGSLGPQLDQLELPRPTPVILMFKIPRIYGTEERVTGFDLAIEIIDTGGALIGEFGGSCSWMTPADWRVLRTATRADLGVPAEPVFPSRDPGTVPARDVGRSFAGNSVISRPQLSGDHATADLTPDPTHVPLFDHAHHHLPGIVQVEGCRQLAVWAAARTLGVSAGDFEVRRAAAQFSAVAEFDLPTQARGTLEPAPDRPGLLARIELVQAHETIGGAEIELGLRL